MYGLLTFVAFVATTQLHTSVARMPAFQTFKVVSKFYEEHVEVPNCGGLDSLVIRNCGTQPKVNTQDLPSFAAGFGEFPWQVAIIDGYEQFFVCSGALIGPRTVLTAAACVGEMVISDIRVRVGEWNILDEGNLEEPFSSEDIPVLKKYLYTDFSKLPQDFSKEAYYGIAVLKLKWDVKFDFYPHVSSVCLPDVDIVNYTALNNCYVAGWGNSPVEHIKKSKSPDCLERSSEMCSRKHSARAAGNNFCLGNGAGVCDATWEELQEPSDFLTPEELEKGPTTDKTAESDLEEVMRRILNKAAVTVASRVECHSRANNDIRGLKSTQLCIFPVGNSQPCKADIGSPVVCQFREVKMSHNTKTESSKFITKKFNKKQEEQITVPQFIVVGIITQTYPCSDDGAVPLVAVSVPRIMNFICGTVTNRL